MNLNILWNVPNINGVNKNNKLDNDSPYFSLAHRFEGMPKELKCSIYEMFLSRGRNRS